MKPIKKQRLKNVLLICFIILLFILFLLSYTISYKIVIYSKDIQKQNETSDIPILRENNNNTQNSQEENTTISEKNTEDTITRSANASMPSKEVNSSSNDWNLILINKNTILPNDFNVNLSSITGNQKVDSRIVEALESMLNDAKSTGLEPLICSSYRTTNKQTQLYNNKVKQYQNLGYSRDKAKDLASYWVAIPRTSEHQTGLAVDIVSKSYQVLDEKQEKTALQQWLINNSYKYGFILRYPNDKRDITMINYEPWHYRYVGVENAEYIKNHNLCLEEFIDYLKQFEDEKTLV